MGKKKNRISTDGGESLAESNPFSGLSSEGLRPAPVSPQRQAPTPTPKPRKGPAPRLDVRRLTGGKGGKTVTEISGFIGVNDGQLQTLAKELKARCGVGGTVKGRAIEIQGDQRNEVSEILEKRGYRIVFTGG